MSNYYENQLNKLNIENLINIQLSDSINKTNNISLNIESIQALKTFLDNKEQDLIASMKLDYTNN